MLGLSPRKIITGSLMTLVFLAVGFFVLRRFAPENVKGFFRV